MLDRIQEHLEAIYGLRCEYRAADFLVDPEAARQLGGTGRSREEVLVLESGEALELALYVDPDLLARVSRYHLPAAAIGSGLAEFCEVAEGVSHFMYLAHTAGLNRTVSLLELEAQAEVDKFAVCTLVRWGQGVARWASSLGQRLFEQVRFHEHLSVAERWRYGEANRLAQSYVAKLMPHIRGGQLDRLLSELRHAYRLGAEAKLAYFSRA